MNKAATSDGLTLDRLKSVLVKTALNFEKSAGVSLLSMDAAGRSSALYAMTRQLTRWMYKPESGSASTTASSSPAPSQVPPLPPRTHHVRSASQPAVFVHSTTDTAVTATPFAVGIASSPRAPAKPSTPFTGSPTGLTSGSSTVQPPLPPRTHRAMTALPLPSWSGDDSNATPGEAPEKPRRTLQKSATGSSTPSSEAVREVTAAKARHLLSALFEDANLSQVEAMSRTMGGEECKFIIDCLGRLADGWDKVLKDLTPGQMAMVKRAYGKIEASTDWPTSAVAGAMKKFVKSFEGKLQAVMASPVSARLSNLPKWRAPGKLLSPTAASSEGTRPVGSTISPRSTPSVSISLLGSPTKVEFDLEEMQRELDSLPEIFDDQSPSSTRTATDKGSDTSPKNESDKT